MKTRLDILLLILLLFTIVVVAISGCGADLVSPDITASPYNLNLEKLSEGRIQFSWIYDYPDEDTVFFYVSKFNGSGWANFHAITEDSFFIDYIPTNDSLVYAYQVSAYNSSAEFTSPKSEIIAYFSEYALPSDITLEQLSQDELKITWDDHSVGEDGFYLDKKIGDEDWQRKYRTLPENSVEFIDPTELYQEVIYKIYAYKGITETDKIEAGLTATLNSPSDLSLEKLDTQKVRLSWTDNSEGEQGFLIDRQKGNLEWEIGYTTVDSNCTTYVDDILEPCGTFNYRIRAYNGDFFSLNSDEATINIFLELVGEIETTGSPQDVFISDATNWYAVIADNFSGLSVVDCVNPSNPQNQDYNQEGLPDRTYSVFVKDNFAYLTTQAGLEEHGWLYVIDLSPILPYHNIDFPPSLSLAGAYPITGNENDTYTPYDIFVQGDYAFIADGENGLDIVYIATSNPGFIANCQTTGIARGIYIENNTAYVASGLGGLDIINVSDPYNPYLEKNYPTTGISIGVKEYNGYIFVADGENGLKIINPSTDEINYIDTGGFVNSLYVQGQDRLQEDHVYILDKEQGLYVIDISEIDNPFILGHYGMESNPISIDKFFQSSYVYIADDTGLKIVQIAP